MTPQPKEAQRELTAQEFIAFWTTAGYRENFAVLERDSGIPGEQIVASGLEPWYNKEHTALEIGCGGGFWVENYLAPNFKQVIGLDIIPEPHQLDTTNFLYIQVPDRNHDCFKVPSNSVDFVWSFGVFCHLPLPAIQRYLVNVHRVLKPGGNAVLNFSDNTRRPGLFTMEVSGDPKTPMLWCKNDIATTTVMLKRAGFTEVTDLLPTLHDPLLHVLK